MGFGRAFVRKSAETLDELAVFPDKPLNIAPGAFFPMAGKID